MVALRPLALGTALFAISACATLPSGGPSASAMQQSPAVDVVDVTPAAAAAARSARDNDAAVKLDRAVAALAEGAGAPVFHFGAGDVVEVTLWSFSPWPGGSAATPAGPTAAALGAFTIAPDGAILLPYAGAVGLAGLTLPEAGQAIAERYRALRILQRPTAALKVAASPHNDILVTGAVGQPRTIGWTPAGVTLAQAVTQALGDGNASLADGDLSSNRAAVRVSVLRDGSPGVELPVAVALERQIALRPGDRVVVRKAPAVEVTVLGGGARRSGVIRFARQPVLADAIAEAGGLDGNVANPHAVFVLRRQNGDRPVLYDFPWSRGEGIVAAQDFPLESGDVVYVAEAPIVGVQKVIGLLFQVTLPVQLLK